MGGRNRGYRIEAGGVSRRRRMEVLQEIRIGSLVERVAME